MPNSSKGAVVVVPDMAAVVGTDSVGIGKSLIDLQLE